MSGRVVVPVGCALLLLGGAAVAYALTKTPRAASDSKGKKKTEKKTEDSQAKNTEDISSGKPGGAAVTEETDCRPACNTSEVLETVDQKQAAPEQLETYVLPPVEKRAVEESAGLPVVALSALASKAGLPAEEGNSHKEIKAVEADTIPSVEKQAVEESVELPAVALSALASKAVLPEQEDNSHEEATPAEPDVISSVEKQTVEESVVLSALASKADLPEQEAAVEPAVSESQDTKECAVPVKEESPVPEAEEEASAQAHEIEPEEDEIPSEMEYCTLDGQCFPSAEGQSLQEELQAATASTSQQNTDDWEQREQTFSVTSSSRPFEHDMPDVDDEKTEPEEEVIQPRLATHSEAIAEEDEELEEPATPAPSLDQSISLEELTARVKEAEETFSEKLDEAKVILEGGSSESSGDGEGRHPTMTTTATTTTSSGHLDEKAEEQRQQLNDMDNSTQDASDEFVKVSSSPKADLVVSTARKTLIEDDDEPQQAGADARPYPIERDREKRLSDSSEDNDSSGANWYDDEDDDGDDTDSDQ